jgi:hypothetical protein
VLAVLRHPFGGFHVEPQAVPTFVLGAGFGASAWVLIDALAERRTTSRSQNGAPRPVDAMSGNEDDLAPAKPLVRGQAARPARAVPERRPAAAAAPVGANARPRHAPRPGAAVDWRHATALPLRLAILLLGLLLSLYILDYVKIAATMGAFASPSDLAPVSRLIDGFAILAIAGAALAIPAPRAAAVVFAATAILGAALALANLWQVPLGLDRTILLMAFVAPWQNVLSWAVLAAVLAVLAAVAHRRLAGGPFFAARRRGATGRARGRAVARG